MAQFIYYRDGDKETGPLDEQAVLDLYNGAEFTSDVTFQIRSSETDSAAPFIMLRDLICKNGPSNPFCDNFSDLDKRIEEAEKELADLRAIAGKKSDLQRRFAAIEKEIEKRKDNSDPGASTSGVKTTEESESRPLCACLSCGLMLANSKQALLHSNLSCPKGVAKTGNLSDLARWKEEDAGRLSMGGRLFSAMSSEEKGSARPSPDFIEDVNDKLKKEMKFGSDAGKQRSMDYMETDAAKKIGDRFEKHLREAKGKLVCNQCKVACKTHSHFIIHLTTYDHRLKVKGTSFELISLLLGSFRGDLYLNEADPSELDENVEPDEVTPKMEAMHLTGGAATSSVR